MARKSAGQQREEGGWEMGWWLPGAWGPDGDKQGSQSTAQLKYQPWAWGRTAFTEMCQDARVEPRQGIFSDKPRRWLSVQILWEADANGVRSIRDLVGWWCLWKRGRGSQSRQRRLSHGKQAGGRADRASELGQKWLSPHTPAMLTAGCSWGLPADHAPPNLPASLWQGGLCSTPPWLPQQGAPHLVNSDSSEKWGLGCLPEVCWRSYRVDDRKRGLEEFERKGKCWCWLAEAWLWLET